MLNTSYYHTSFSDDLNGVEVSAAIKNIFSIAVGAEKGLCRKNISNEDRTIILYESPHRILKTLRELSQCCPQKNIVVLKELTKIHEKTYRGEINNIISDISKSRLKGEFIIVLNGEN